LEVALSFLAGLALWVLAMTLTARLSIHFPLTYSIAIAVILITQFSYIRSQREWTLKNAFFQSRFTLASFPLIFVLAAHWLVVLKPEVSTDGLSMHMAIADNFARNRAFTFDFHHNIWALMPVGADWAYSIVYVLGGEYAARLLNFIMLLAVVQLIFH